MEPMAASTETVRDQEERQKFRSGLVRKRKREDGEKQVKKRGPKEPNPLSVKSKSTAKLVESGQPAKMQATESIDPAKQATESIDPAKKRRKRKHKSRKPAEASENIAEN